MLRVCMCVPLRRIDTYTGRSTRTAHARQSCPFPWAFCVFPFCSLPLLSFLQPRFHVMVKNIFFFRFVFLFYFIVSL